MIASCISKKLFWIMLLSIPSFFVSGLSAQTLTGFRVSSVRVPINTPITAYVEFQPAQLNWCGFYINWGDGNAPQSFRIGKNPDVSSPVSRQRSYEHPGTYSLTAYGDSVLKGLNSAPKCEGVVPPITVTVFDPKDEAAKQQESIDRKAKELQASQVAAQLELEKQRLELARLELENKKKELELEKLRLNDPAYQKQQAEIERQRIVEEQAKKAAEESKLKEEERLAREARKKKIAEEYAEKAAREAKRKEDERLAIEAEKNRIAGEESRKKEAMRKERERVKRDEEQRIAFAKEYPFVAILTCGMGGPDHINILACFAGGRGSANTELKLRNGSEVNIFKAYNFNQAGTEKTDGFHINLREKFELTAQNSNENLVLGIKVLDRVSRKVMYSDVVARFGVIRVSN